MRIPRGIPFILLALAAFGLTPHASRADDEVGAKSRRTFFAGDVGLLSFASGRSRELLGTRTGVLVGVAGGYRVVRWLELEARGEIASAGYGLREGTITTAFVTVGGRAFLGDAPVAPYVELHTGVGKITSTCIPQPPPPPGFLASDCVVNSHTHVSFAAGIGVEWRVSDLVRVASTLTVTRTAILNPDPAFEPPSGRGGSTTPRDDARSWLSMSVALRMRF